MISKIQSIKSTKFFQFCWRSQIKAIIGQQNMIDDLFELQEYNTDWTKKYKGFSKLAISPRNTQQLSQVMRILCENNIGVVPQGGKTSLVGGSVPLQNEVILLMKHFNEIQNFDPDTNIITLEPGCILQNVNDYLKQFDCEMPWDLGSRGTCQVGGNVATNAGGLNVIKRGLLKGYVLGMEVVLASGKILDLTNTNRKDNTGFDLKQLFIGSEGCLGIITKLNIQTSCKAKEKRVLFIKLRTYQDVIQTLQLAKKQLLDSLCAFEFIEGRLVAKTCNLLNLQNPFDQSQEISSNDYNYYVLLESQGDKGIDQIIENYVEKLMEKGLCMDCVLNKNEKEYNDLWQMREGLAEAQGRMGLVLKYDISLPPSEFENFVLQIHPNRKTEGPFDSFYGHVGDGNMHYNLIFDTYEDLKREQMIIEPKIMALVKKYRGSISAEHGIGQNKIDYLPDQKGPEVMNLMKQIKNLMDPDGILNPGKVIKLDTNQELTQITKKV